jgi:ectoine hydroxylase-related dioxygenase (phytanoyl-CoA dioxygenase family)
MNAVVESFKEKGFLVIPDALAKSEVEALNGAIDTDQAVYPQLWQVRGEGGRQQSVAALLSSGAFDIAIRHPSIWPAIEEIMGAEVCFEEFSIMVRLAYAGEPLAPSWHRDTGHWLEHPYCVKNLSVVYYLTDVDADSHCFAIVPERVEQKKEAPDQRDGEGGIEIYATAGTAILFNAASCHAGIVKRTERERRTIHIYYGHRSQPILSNHTLCPRRLLESANSQERDFYGRPNLMTQLVRDNY